MTIKVLEQLLSITKSERAERVYKQMIAIETEKRSRGGNHLSA